MTTQTIGMTRFASRHFNPEFTATKISSHTPEEIVEMVNQAIADGAELVDGFAPFVKHLFLPNPTDAKMGIAKITPESLAKKKEQTLKQLDGFDQFLGKLEEAKTAEEFNMALMPMTAMIMALNNMGGKMPDLEATGSDTVTIVIQTEIDDKTDEALADTLIALTDNPDLGLALSDVAEGKTKFEVSPVKDVDAFAKKIDFGKVVRIDAEKRQITVELKKSENEPPKKKPE